MRGRAAQRLVRPAPCLDSLTRRFAPGAALVRPTRCRPTDCAACLLLHLALRRPRHQTLSPPADKLSNVVRTAGLDYKCASPARGCPWRSPLRPPRQHRPPLRPASPPLGLRSLCTILRITTALSGRLASDPRYLSRCSNPTIVADIRLPLNPLERPQRCSPSLALPPRTLHDTQARLSIRNIDSTQRPPSTLC